MVNATLDVSILDNSPAWRDNPEFIRTATRTGHYIDCAHCHRVIGIGKDDEAARDDVKLNRTGVPGKDDRFYCMRCSTLTGMSKRK